MMHSFTTRWKRDIGAVKTCYVPDCTVTDTKTTKIHSAKELLEYFEPENEYISLNELENVSENVHVPLCSS